MRRSGTDMRHMGETLTLWVRGANEAGQPTQCRATDRAKCFRVSSGAGDGPDKTFTYISRRRIPKLSFSDIRGDKPTDGKVDLLMLGTEEGAHRLHTTRNSSLLLEVKRPNGGPGGFPTFRFRQWLWISGHPLDAYGPFREYNRPRISLKAKQKMFRELKSIRI